MSYAVHDSQPSQRWNGGMYTSSKRKPSVTAAYDSVATETRPNKKATTQMNNEVNDMNSSSNSSKPSAATLKQSDNKRGAVSDSGNQFLIDGTLPRRPSPHLLEKRTETRNGPGRHRSVDLKGLIMELIDETYPPFVCPSCDHTASARSLVDSHFKSAHHGVKAFKCVHTKCDQAYSSKPGLRYHLEHAHNVTLNTGSHAQTNQSSKSSKSTSSSKLISNSKQQHTNHTNVESNSKKLKKQELSPYLQNKLDSTYNITVCPSCKEQFKRKTHVIRHLVEVHHGEEPYKCVVSNCKRTKTYATREGLVYHLASYHDE